MRAGRAASRARSAAVGVTALAVAAVLLAPPAVAATAEREPSIGPGLEWVAHRDNPFRQGDDADFINSDLAFTGDYLVQGNYAGFSIWDIADPAAPELVSAVSCPGGQGDVSTVGNLVIVAIDETMSDDSCEASRVPETDENWEGIRIFDISDPRAPRYAAAVRTRCGSHTHTVVPDPGSADRVFVYVNAYSRGASLNCTGRNPLQIVEVPLAAPEQAAIVGELDLFDDETAFGPEDRVAGGAETRSTTGCHDITAYPAKGLAVAACRGDGLLLSIADPLAPVVLQRVRDPAVAFWHSGIFDNDATRIVFQDELGDGFINTCSPAFGADRGADAVWLIQPDGLVKAGTYKLPRTQSDLEKCVAHSGGLVPVPDRFIIAQAWLEGGVSVVDLTDPAAPVELTWFDRPDYGYSMDYTAGIWAVYHYGGYLYASDMFEGLEVLRLTDPAFADAAQVRRHRTEPPDAALVRVGVARGSGGADRGRGACAARDALGRAGRARAGRVRGGHRRAAARVAHARRDRRRVVDADAVRARDGHRLGRRLARRHRGRAARSPRAGSLRPRRARRRLRAAPGPRERRRRARLPRRRHRMPRPPRPDGGGAWWILVLVPFALALAYHAAIAWRRRRRRVGP